MSHLSKNFVGHFYEEIIKIHNKGVTATEKTQKIVNLLENVFNEITEDEAPDICDGDFKDKEKFIFKKYNIDAETAKNTTETRRIGNNIRHSKIGFKANNNDYISAVQILSMYLNFFSGVPVPQEVSNIYTNGAEPETGNNKNTPSPAPQYVSGGAENAKQLKELYIVYQPTLILFDAIFNSMRALMQQPIVSDDVLQMFKGKMDTLIALKQKIHTITFEYEDAEINIKIENKIRQIKHHMGITDVEIYTKELDELLKKQ